MKIATLILLALTTTAALAASADRLVENPYKFVLDEADLPEQGLSRFFMDVNDDKIPDLFVAENGLMGNAGGEFHVFLARSDRQFEHLGAVFLHPKGLELLDSRHNGVRDLLVYHRDGGKSGDYNEFHFDGGEFVKAASIRGSSKAFPKALKPSAIKVERSESGLF